MASRISRRKIASLVADKLIAGQPTEQVLRDVAVFLVDTRRTREQRLLVRDIEAALAERGLIIADVTSARPIDSSLMAEIKTLTGAKSLQLRTAVDEPLLGGVRIDVPGGRFDGTIRRKLNALKAKQL